ncbi:hypothetical protein KCU95_g2335, partial [Aureobasidium melanogenum]
MATPRLTDLEAALDSFKAHENSSLAIVVRGGVEDIVQFDPEIDYFYRNNITHLGKFTCDYETGYLYNINKATFARGNREVSVDYRHNFTPTGDADRDVVDYDQFSWQWFET